MGVLVIKKSAAAKIGNLVVQSGNPAVKPPIPGWLGDWLGFHMLNACLWLWNLPSKLLLALTYRHLSASPGAEEDYLLLHSVLLFDAITGQVRFDGLSSLKLVEELGRVCDFA